VIETQIDRISLFLAKPRLPFSCPYSAFDSRGPNATGVAVSTRRDFTRSVRSGSVDQCTPSQPVIADPFLPVPALSASQIPSIPSSLHRTPSHPQPPGRRRRRHSLATPTDSRTARLSSSKTATAIASAANSSCCCPSATTSLNSPSSAHTPTTTTTTTTTEGFSPVSSSHFYPDPNAHDRALTLSVRRPEFNTIRSRQPKGEYGFHG
jgi:hypothetical protein